MTEESTTPDLVELTRAYYELMDRDWDIDAVMRFWAPDAVFDLSPMGLLTRIEGAAAIRESIAERRVRPTAKHELVGGRHGLPRHRLPPLLGEPSGGGTRLVDVGDRVVVRQMWRGFGRGPEANIEMTIIFTLRQGRVTCQEYFWDHAEALKAVGLEE